MNNNEDKKLSFAGLRNVIEHSVRLTRIMWPGNKAITLSLAFIFLINALMPFAQAGVFGLMISGVIKSVEIGAMDSTLIIAFIGLAVVGIVMATFMPLQDYLMRRFISRANERFEIITLEAAARVDFAVREDSKNMVLLNNANENWWRPREFLMRQYFMLQNLIEVIVASSVVIFISPWVFILLLAGAIPELIIELKYGREMWGIYGARAEIRRHFWNIKLKFQENNYIFDMKLFQNVGHFIGMIKNLLIRFMVDENRVNDKILWKHLGSRLISQASIIIGTILFVFSAIHGHIVIGTLVFIISSIGSLRTSLSGFFQNLGKQFQDSLFIGDIFKLMDMKPLLEKPADGIVLSSAQTPEIIFEHVTFSYPASASPVLKDFSLRIKPGDKVALIGINGAGKTTFVKLLCRFYDPQEGRILINGHDLKTLDLEAWYSLIGILFQDYANYHLTTKEIIALGRTSKATDLEKVKESARAAEADTFIAEWEKNYDQQLGSWLGGIEPSIGQWQKLALARTFYRDPRILILDEPTSSIDAEAEAKIFEKLEALPKDRTVILISHRFSTVRQADQIVVIEDGKIKEHGRHEELLKKKGTYAKLFNLQAKGYK